MGKFRNKPKFTSEDLGENTFLSTLEILVNEVKSSDKYKVHDQHSGEDAIFELASFSHEAVPYCKLFSDAERRTKMAQLTPRAKDLFLWVLYQTEHGKDYLWLNKEMYMEESRVKSVNTLRDAVNDLVKKKFLGKTVIQDVYWINPHYFFKGDRMKTFKHHIKINKSKKES